MSYDCFISYASIDLDFAEELNKRLVAHGFKVWFDKARLQPGFDWYREIEEGCENSRVMLPGLTPNWKASEWTKFETYGAESVIPLIVDGSWDDVKTPPLEKYQAEVMNFTIIAEADWERLYSFIRTILTKEIPEKEKRIISLKYRPNDFFIGREKDLIKIHEEFHINPKAALTLGRVRVVTANGGYGKTTLVRQYAEKFWRCYIQMFWVDGRLDLESEFAHIHDLLFPDLINSGFTKTEKARLALRELQSAKVRLLIMDNVEDEVSIRNWIPTTGSCYVLITSRFARWSAAIRTIPMNVLDHQAAQLFLQNRAGRIVMGKELEACKVLATKLGFLPLALEQAAAYIEQQEDEFGFEEYLKLYEIAFSELLAKGVLGSNDYPDSVFTTWKPTIAKLTPGARTILRLASFLATTPIPVNMFFKSGSLIYHPSEKYGQINFKEPTNHELWIRDELSLLTAYSLITKEGDSFYLHPLLQVIEQYNNEDNLKDEFNKNAEQLFFNSLPVASWREDCRRYWTEKDDRLWRLILPHGYALDPLKNSTNPLLLSGIGNALASTGEIESALDYCVKAYSYSKSTLGDEDAQTINMHEDVGYLYRQNNRLDESYDAFLEIWKLRSQLLGDEDVHTLRALHNLAIVEKEQGKYDEALEKMQQVTQLRTRVLGEKDYDTITSIHDQGWLYAGLNENAEAIKYYMAAMKVWEVELGQDSPDTLTAMINLVLCYRSLKRYDEALALCIRTVEISTRAHGIYSKFTRRSVKDMADVLYEKADYDESLIYYRKYSEICDQTMVTGDPRRWEAKVELIERLWLQNRRDEAEEISERAIADFHQFFATQKDDHHQITIDLAIVSNLASVLDLMEKTNEAKLLRLKYRGIKHKSLENNPLELRKLALEYFNLQEYAEAENLLRHILTLNFEPPSTHCHLARIFLLTNRYAEAKKEINIAAEFQENVPDYVVLRVLFFQILMAFMDNENATVYLNKLKEAFQLKAAHLEWTIGPVIQHVTPSLTSDKVEFLVAIANALSTQENMKRLDEFSLWNEI